MMIVIIMTLIITYQNLIAIANDLDLFHAYMAENIYLVLSTEILSS